MGIVRGELLIEEWLTDQMFSWKTLSDYEYRKVVSSWRESFEERLISKSVTSGKNAYDEIENLLPFSCYLFNCPNYKHLDDNLGRDRQVTYAYRVDMIKNINRNLLNCLGAIVCQDNFEFMCAFSYEGTGFGCPEVFCKSFSERN